MDESSWTWPEMRGLPVHDVNGARLGRVHDAHDGVLRVTLDEAVARRLDVRGTLLIVPFREITDADDHDVTLREEGVYLAHPGSRPRLEE